MPTTTFFFRLFKVSQIAFGIIMLTSSCTVLQWRASDNEILEKFNTLNIATEISYLKVDSLDLKIRVQQISSEENRINVVFFHGSPSSLSAWDKYLTDTTLAKKANLIAIDRPGYGYSNFGDEMVSIDQQAQLMSNLINVYNLKNIIAVGSSYGGPLAARLAILNKKVKAVIMISPAIDPEVEKKIWGSRLTQWWTTRWLVPTGYRVAGDEKTVHARELALLKNDWKTLDIPVVHIHGDIDDIVPYENIAFSQANFKDITIITTPNTGHEIAWAKPHLIIPHLTERIDSLEKTVKTQNAIKKEIGIN